MLIKKVHNFMCFRLSDQKILNIIIIECQALTKDVRYHKEKFYSFYLNMCSSFRKVLPFCYLFICLLFDIHFLIINSFVSGKIQLYENLNLF